MSLIAFPKENVYVVFGLRVSSNSTRSVLPLRLCLTLCLRGGEEMNCEVKPSILTYSSKVIDTDCPSKKVERLAGSMRMASGGVLSLAPPSGLL